jgi:hypothetical protein
MCLSRKSISFAILALTARRAASRSLFIGGGQRGLRFGGRLLCLLDDDRMDDPADWLGDRLFLLSGVGFVWSGFAGLPGLTG